MSTRDHTFWTGRLSDFLDGGLEADECREMERHLAECGECRTILAELDEVREAAGRLESPPPERDLWPGIAAVIRTGRSGKPARTKVIELPTSLGARELASAPGLFLTLPQLAAAALVLVATSAVLTWAAGPGIGTREMGSAAPTLDAPVAMVAEVAAPPADLVQELTALESVLSEARERLDPGTLRILEKNLQVIERAIEDSKQALAVDPGNAFVRDHLEATYRKKADYLREARDLVEWIG